MSVGKNKKKRKHDFEVRLCVFFLKKTLYFFQNKMLVHSNNVISNSDKALNLQKKLNIIFEVWFNLLSEVFLCFKIKSVPIN